MVEILRTAGKNISTPIMEVPFHKNITKAYATALQIKLTEVPLAKVSSVCSCQILHHLFYAVMSVLKT